MSNTQRRADAYGLLPLLGFTVAAGLFKWLGDWLREGAAS